MINKYTLGTIVGTALLGFAKKQVGSSIKLKTVYRTEYSYSQGWFTVDTNELPFDMSNYIINYDQDGFATFPDTYDLFESSIYGMLNEIQDDEYDKLVEKTFDIRDGEEVQAYIHFNDNATKEYIDPRHASFVNENGRIIGCVVEIFFTYKIKTMDKNLIKHWNEVEIKFEKVSKAIIALIHSKLGITLDDRFLPIELDAADDDVIVMAQTKQGKWVPYEPKNKISRLRKR